MKTIVGIGANVYDTLITVSSYPIEDTKMPSEGVIHCGGGPCATALAAASRLGAKCDYIGALSSDVGGKFLFADFQRFGVGTDFIDVKDNTDTFASYVLLNLSSGTRTCVFSKTNLPTFVIDEEKKKAIENADILMVDGNELENAIVGAKIAKNASTKVLYDAGGNYPGVEKLLPYVDILIPSEEFSLKFTGEKTVEAAAKKLYDMFSPEVVVITQGKDGGVILYENNLRHYPAFKVDAIDSNGAGDVFHGAFGFAAANGFSYYDACVFSSAVSAIKCQKIGARDAVPNYKETIDFLKERGYDEFKEKLEW